MPNAMAMPVTKLPKLPDWLVMAGLSGASILALAWIELAPQPASNVAVVFPPWVSAGEVARRTAAAGATLVRSGGFSFVLIVHPTSQGFVRRAIAEGAFLVLNADTVSGCGSPGSQAT